MIDKSIILDQINKLLSSQKEVSWAYIYGSFLNSDSFEDLDIAVYLESSYLGKCSSIIDIEQKIGSHIEKNIAPRIEIDLKIINKAPINFQYRVMKNGKLVFFRNPQEIVKFNGDLISLYLDYKQTNQFFEKKLLERIDKW